MKISLRIKVVVMTVLLSMALIGSSVLISSIIFANRSQKEAQKDIGVAASGMAERITDYSDYYEFFAGTTEDPGKGYVSKMRNIYENNYEDLVYHLENGFSSVSEEEDFYADLVSSLFPPKNGMLGLSQEKLSFQVNYYDVLNEVLLVANNFDAEGGYLYIYDSENDYIIYLMDCTSQKSPLYMYPGSIQRPSEQWLTNTYDNKEESLYSKEIDGTQYCYGNCPIVDKNTGEVVAYVGYNYNMDKLQSAQNDFIKTITVIMVVAMAVITVIYLVFAEFFLIRNIRKLSRSTVEYTKKLDSAEPLSPVDSDIKAKDEIGQLSKEFFLMQQKISEYVDTIAEKQEEEHRRNAELSVAARIQLESLPAPVYSDRNNAITASVTPAKEVGGDFYDYFYIDDKHFAVVIADVSGKGVPAALFMMKAMGLIHKELQSKKNLSEAVAFVNERLVENNASGLFVTAFIGVVDVDTGEMECVSAGHERPYLFDGEKVVRTEVDPNFVLGGLSGFSYKTQTLSVKDKRLFLFTDGLNESINDRSEEFGYERIEEVLKKAATYSQKDLLAEVEGAMKAFVGDKEAFDDVTMLVYEQAGERKMSLRFDDPDFGAIESATEHFNYLFSHLDKEVMAKIDIVFDEVINNLVSYEKKDKSFYFTLDVEEKEGQLTIVVLSNGEEFNPLTVQEKYLGSDLSEEKAGGFGVMITKSICDEVTYKRTDGKNVLTLKKRI